MRRYAPPACASVDELERKYWKNVAFNPPIYGADVTGTLIDDDQDVWNLNHLGTILDCVNEDYGVQVNSWRNGDIEILIMVYSPACGTQANSIETN